MSNTPETAEAPSRPHRRGRWLLGLGVLAILTLVVTVARKLQSQRESIALLQQTMAELDRTDPGWRLEDIEAARATVPDDENGALCVLAASKHLPKSWPTEEFAEQFEHLVDNEQLSPRQIQLLEKELGSLRPALEEGRRLADRPTGRYPIAYSRDFLSTRLPHVLEARKVAGLLPYDALLRAQQGDLKGALRSCRATANAGRSFGDEPFAITQIVRLACVNLACQAAKRVLGQGEPAPRDLAELQHLLESEDKHPALLILLRGERAGIHQHLSVVESGEVPLEKGKSSSSIPPWLLDWLGIPSKETIRTYHARWLSSISQEIAVAAQPLPLPQRGDELQDLHARLLAQQADGPLKIFIMDLPTAELGLRRQHARIRCTLTALALERYRQMHGTWPETLDRLAPELLKTVPLDPFDGKPLRYRRRADGVVVYAVGDDLQDNGGNVGSHSAKNPGEDLGCRLWDVASRRQPPRPEPPPVPPRPKPQPGFPGNPR